MFKWLSVEKGPSSYQDQVAVSVKGASGCQSKCAQVAVSVKGTSVSQSKWQPS